MIPIYSGNYRMLKRYLQYEIDDNLVDCDAAYAKRGSKVKGWKSSIISITRNARFLNILDSVKSANKYRPKLKTRHDQLCVGWSDDSYQVTQ